MAFFGLFSKAKTFNDFKMKEIEKEILQAQVDRNEIVYDLTKIKNDMKMTIEAGVNGDEITNSTLASDYEILKKSETLKQSQLNQLNTKLISLAGLKTMKEQESQGAKGIFEKLSLEDLEKESTRIGEERIKTDELFSEITKITDISVGTSSTVVSTPAKSEFEKLVEEGRKNQE